MIASVCLLMPVTDTIYLPSLARVLYSFCLTFADPSWLTYFLYFSFAYCCTLYFCGWNYAADVWTNGWLLWKKTNCTWLSLHVSTSLRTSSYVSVTSWVVLLVYLHRILLVWSYYEHLKRLASPRFLSWGVELLQTHMHLPNVEYDGHFIWLLVCYGTLWNSSFSWSHNRWSPTEFSRENQVLISFFWPLAKKMK